jgi:hypothetical protein
MDDTESTGSLEHLLRKIGPASSGAILRALTQRGLSSEAARKRLSRAKPPIQVLPGLRLPERARFWFLSEQRGRDAYWNRLLQALEETNSAYGVALHGLHARGGLVPEDEFAVVAGCPSRPRRRQITAKKVAEVLIQIGLIRSVNEPTLGSCLTLTTDAPLRGDSSARRRATDIAESILLAVLADWSGKLGLISAGKVRCRRDKEAPEVAGYNWDLSAPSYLSPFQRQSSSGTRPGFVAADVILGRGLTLQQCRFFLKKCAGVRAQQGVPPLLPLLVADAFEKEAFAEGRKHGFVFATPQMLFGEEVAEALRVLIDVMANASTKAADPDRLDQILRVLATTERAHDQLRGPLFELLVGHCVGQSFAVVEFGRNEVHPETGEQVNIDVLGVNPRVRVVAYECKGRRADGIVSLQEVEKWFSRQIPRIYAYFKGHPGYRDIRPEFEFWTTGRFSEDAEAFLRVQKDQVRRFDLAWMDGPAVERVAKQFRLPAISKILADHFGPAAK